MTPGRVAVTSMQDDISLMDFFFQQEKAEEGSMFELVNEIARAFGNEEFRYIRRNSVLMIRLIVSESRLEDTWKDIIGETGDFISYNVYSLPREDSDSNFWYSVRMVYEKRKSVCVST